MTDFGTDATLDARLGMISGRELLVADLIARLEEEPGGLYYDLAYGGGLLLALNDDVGDATLAKLAANAEATLRRDERVSAVSCSASFSDTAEQVTLRVRIEDAEGPFEFVYAPTETVVGQSSGLSSSPVFGGQIKPTQPPWGGWDSFWPSYDPSDPWDDGGIFDDTFDDTFA